MTPTQFAIHGTQLSRFLPCILLASVLGVGHNLRAEDNRPAKSKYATDYTEPRSAERRYSYGTESHQFPSPEYTDAKYPDAEAPNADDSGSKSSDQKGSYRQPVDIKLLSDSTAIIPCKLTGELYELDLKSEAVSFACSFAGRRWTKLAVLGPKRIALADDERPSVVILEKIRDQSGWSEIKEFRCHSRVGDLAWSESTRTLYASEVWGRRLIQFKLNNNAWVSGEAIDIGVAGGQIGLLEKHNRVFIADNFSRRYCLIDLKKRAVCTEGELYGHNISDIQVNSDESQLIYSSQMLNEFIETKRGEIVWGGLLSNNLRRVDVATLLTAEGSHIFAGSRFIPVGDVGNGAGDPMAFAIAPGTGTSDQQIAVALGGTNRLALTQIEQHQLQKVDVGLHPVACQFTPDGNRIIVVNQFEDSLAVVDLSDGLSNRRVRRISLGPLRKPTQVERGEQLFFNSRLSHDGWMSCNSCHGQGHTNSQLNDNTTDGSFGSPKRVLSLLGNKGTAPFGWNGRFRKLEEQVEHSLRSTMACDLPVTEEMVADLTAFVGTLEIPEQTSDYSASETDVPAATQGKHASDESQQGRALFKKFGCSDCHNPQAKFTSAETYDIGLVDEQDLREFNPPSLLGVSLRQESLLHDGRANSIRELLLEHKHQLPASAKNKEVMQLIEYLRSF